MSENCNFIKKETLVQVFSCEFCKISKNTLFTEHLRLSCFTIFRVLPPQRSLTRSKIRFCSVANAAECREILKWNELNYSLCSTSNYMFKVNNRNTRTRCELCSKLTIKTPQNDAIGVVLVSLLLTLNVFHSLF